MSNIWFTSDTHFGHANIIKYCNRPVQSVAEMDELLTQNWNDSIRAEDIVYHLGDVTFYKDPELIEAVMSRLNGIKHLIIGNHDKVSVIGKYFYTCLPYHELYRITKHPIILSHYPIESWNMKFHNSIHLHGHTHGTIDNSGLRRFDVGVDCWVMKPVNLDEILEVAEKGIGVPDLSGPNRRGNEEAKARPKNRDQKFGELYERASKESGND